jgi:ABC-type branched-subunit amino acid transport system ATPase component
VNTADLVLVFDGLVAGYGDTMVLRGIGGTLAAGQVLGVLGRNGVGKTTLMRALTGTIALKHGTVRMRGADMAGIDLPRRLAAGMAYAPQENTVFGDLSVEENLRVHLRERGLARYADCFDAFPRLRERLAQRAGALCGGER